ncbi:MAG: hypothetical protein ACKO5Q_20455, partial [Microcystaceae cyanobacterium]
MDNFRPRPSLAVPLTDDSNSGDFTDIDVMSPADEAALTGELPDLVLSEVVSRQRASTDLVRLYLQ